MMRILKISLLLTALFLVHIAGAQTVVKMDLPPQADRPLTVVALFDEEIPEGIPVVLGLMGYDVEGGMTPYLFEWIHNGAVISTNDVAIFTPQKGDDLLLKVTDGNKCRASTAFNLKVAHIPGNPDDGEGGIRVFPTSFRERIFVQFPHGDQHQALVRIFTMNGIEVFHKYLTESSYLNLNLSPGVYFISVKTGVLHKVEKIIAQ